MEFAVQTSFNVYELHNKNFGFDQTHDNLVNIHQEFETMNKANEWIYDNGLSDVNYTILEVQRKRRIN